MITSQGYGIGKAGAGASGAVTGSGTPNRIPLWSAATVLGDSVMNQTASGVELDSGKDFSWQDSGFKGSMNVTTLTADRTYTLQDGDGTLAFLSDLAITNNVIPKGTGTGINDGTWEFSGNSILPTNTGSDIGTVTNRIGTIYMASTVNIAAGSDLSFFKAGGAQQMRLTNGGNLLFANNAQIDVETTGGSDVLNIGTSNADVVNIGTSGVSVVNIQGTLSYQNVTNLEVEDKLFTVNKGGGVASGTAAGFEIEENSVITGYFRTSGDRLGWDFEAPANTGNHATLSLTNLTGDITATLQDASGTLAYLSDVPSGVGNGVANRATYWTDANTIDAGTWEFATNDYRTVNSGSNLGGTAAANRISTIYMSSTVDYTGTLSWVNSATTTMSLDASGNLDVLANFTTAGVSVVSSGYDGAFSKGISVSNGNGRMLESGGVMSYASASNIDVQLKANGTGNAIVQHGGASPARIYLKESTKQTAFGSFNEADIDHDFDFWAGTDNTMRLLANNASGATTTQDAIFAITSQYWDGAATQENLSQIRNIATDTSGGHRQGYFVGGSERLTILSGGNVGIAVSAPAEPLHVNGNSRVDGRLLVTQDNYLFNGTTVASYVANNRGNMIEFIDGGGINLNNYNNLLGANTGTQNFNSYFVDYNFAATQNSGGDSGRSYIYADQNGANSAPFTRIGINGQNTTFTTLFQTTLDNNGTAQAANVTVHDIVDSYGAHNVDLGGVDHYKTGFKSSLTSAFTSTTTGDGVVRTFWANAQGGDVNQSFYSESGNIVLDGTGGIQQNSSADSYFTGDVGIGLTAPAEKLHVNGNGRFDGNVNVNASAGNEYKVHGQAIMEFASWATSYTSNGVDDANNPAIYSARGTTGAPFNQSGNLIIKGRNNATTGGKIFMITSVGGTNTETARFSAGNFSIGGATNPSTMVGGLAWKNGTAPTSDVTDQFSMYSADIVAGNAAPHFRSENGSIIKLYQANTYTVTNATPDRTFDASSTTLNELANVVAAMIEDNQSVGFYG